MSEMPNLIHILALCIKDKVLSPLNLQTKAKLEYFKALNETNVLDIKELERLLTNKNFNKKVCDILKNNNLEKHNIIIQLLKKDCINFKSFEILFKLLKDHGFIGNLKCLYAWEKLKEHSFRNDFHIIHVDFKKTKKYEKYRDKAVLVRIKVAGKSLKTLKATLREYFGKQIN